ncbi:TetR/AcrR family transcriptional regulator [Companilactobacillus keshanensis]|uniref:TetR/AcrR family transcriptional regulator n=1 Tax=Companilactobacillus keshanensis TaxID=2486003 RepID=A0ABW4BTV2_9LACO|nr:TetR/AcrR family transcriptional regulator [Companilactobacillus keshanensis]
MTKREIATAVTRENIIETAESLLQQKGYEKMSVSDITRASGVAKGTFYNYFNKKEDIIFELNKRHMSDLSDQITKFSQQDPAESIRNYLSNFLQTIVNSQVNMARQWVRFVTASQNQEKWQYDNELLKRLLQRLIDNGKLKLNTPIEELSLLLITEVYGIIFSWCISPETVQPVTNINSFCDMQLELLLKPYL